MELFTFKKVSFEQFKQDMDKLYGQTYRNRDRELEIISNIQNKYGYAVKSDKKERVDGSWDQFVRNAYENIKLPCAATSESAGFDFFMPFDLQMEPGTTVTIPTGIRWIPEALYDFLHVHKHVYIRLGAHMCIYPRSGLGFKYHVSIANTVGIIDADYCKSDNEGHIMIRLHYPSIMESNLQVSMFNPSVIESVPSYIYTINGGQVPKCKSAPLKLNVGSGFAQGIVTMYLKNPEFTKQEERNGGFGSTGK